MSSVVLEAIKETSNKENGLPQNNRNYSGKQIFKDDFYEFLLVTIISIIISLLPLVVSALFSNNSSGSFWDQILVKPDILFTILTLAITVVCEIWFLDVKKDRLIKAMGPALMLCIFWLLLVYGYYQFSNKGSWGDIYRHYIICISAGVIIILSVVSMFFADRANKKS